MAAIMDLNTPLSVQAVRQSPQSRPRISFCTVQAPVLFQLYGQSRDTAPSSYSAAQPPPRWMIYSVASSRWHILQLIPSRKNGVFAWDWTLWLACFVCRRDYGLCGSANALTARPARLDNHNSQVALAHPPPYI